MLLNLELTFFPMKAEVGTDTPRARLAAAAAATVEMAAAMAERETEENNCEIVN
ncbi:hypothetical protein GCM10010261_67720 [Streptomyces pilosus]|uniref:Uncharacterized protein n=1 Tax=Streptomyces canarius TaxID=285453 RepID=A0ABQ3DC86_9ACTN|nr:hypothetical protein GCM10010205_82560 [Streptomyces nojiriensis]GGV71999.1 hypothetical protein GCM10010261_67720 [Streptomyces pilosus]GHA79412.1 hypothetical protein GCM10010345_95010 [Streptomyces canarius]GHH24930.1 hypothetical protein GCM10017674_82110 [Streptomyces gardneri]